jgi:hypothetical protein
VTRKSAAPDREASAVVLVIVALVYNVVAMVLAVWAPAAARRAAARGDPQAQREYGCYLATVLLILIVVPLLACFVLDVFWAAGAFAFALWVVFAWPGMLALLLRVVTEAATNAIACLRPVEAGRRG